MGNAAMIQAANSLYLCIHVPEFPTQARLRFRQQEMSRAVVILDGIAPLEIVCSATSKAFQKGIVRGMTQVQLEHFSDLTVMSRSLAEERVARNALLELADGFTPNVQVLAGSMMTCELVLDLTGTTRLLGYPQHTLLRIQQALQTIGMYASLAVSSNFHTAVCAAPYASNDGIVIARGEESLAMHHLPLAALRLTEQQTNTFEIWGLKTCGDLSRLPDVELIARMGQAGKNLQLLARGKQPHFFVPEQVEFTLEEHTDLEDAIGVLDHLMWAIQPMFERLVRRAAVRSLALASARVTLTLDKATLHDTNDASRISTEDERLVKPAVPLTECDLLAGLLCLDLQARPPLAAVKAIHIHAEPGKTVRAQLSFFSSHHLEPARLDVTLARISALVGDENVGSARLHNTHLPDQFSVERFVPSASFLDSVSATSTSSVAVRRVRPPTVLRLRLKNQKPFAFLISGRRYVVEEAQGPWRLSGNWWSQEIWSRDEWDVRAVTQDGEVLLGSIEHDLLHKHWYLTAQYD